MNEGTPNPWETEQLLDRLTDSVNAVVKQHNKQVEVNDSVNNALTTLITEQSEIIKNMATLVKEMNVQRLEIKRLREKVDACGSM